MPIATMQVVAREGVRVPMEGMPRRYIGAAAETVPTTHYYLRQLADGDLVRVPDPASDPTPAPPKKAL